MPKPGKNESESDFVKRCIPVVMHEGSAEGGSQAAAMCHSIWREHKKEIDALPKENVSFEQWIKQAVPILMRGGQDEEHASQLCKIMWEEDQMPKMTNSEFCRKLVADPSRVNKEFFYDLAHTVPVLAEYAPNELKFLRIKRLAPKVEEKKEDKKQRKVISGFAATTDLDRDEEKFSLNALSEAKDQLLKTGSSTVFFNHDWHDWPVGRVVATDIAKTDNNQDGLWVEIELADNEDGDKIFNLVKQGILTSFSVSFRPKETESIKDEKGQVIERTFNKVDLFEVSVVGIPANPNAVIGDFFLKSLSKSFGPERQTTISKDSIRQPIISSVLPIKQEEKEMTPEERKELAALVAEMVTQTIDARDAAQKKADEERKKLRDEIRAELKALEGSGKEKPPDLAIPTVVIPKEMTDTLDALKKELGELKENVSAIKVVKEHKGGDKPAVAPPAAGGDAISFEELIKRPDDDVEKALVLMGGYETDKRCKSFVDELKVKNPTAHEAMRSIYLRNYLGTQSLTHQALKIAQHLMREGASKEDGDKEINEGDE